MQIQPNNILAFLKSKKWEVAETTEKYFSLTPPKEIEFSYDFRYNIPRYEGGKDTPQYLLDLIKGISKMYDLDKFNLIELLSKQEKELQQEIEKQKKELAEKEAYLLAMKVAS